MKLPYWLPPEPISTVCLDSGNILLEATFGVAVAESEGCGGQGLFCLPGMYGGG